jgi:hypothetical protein
MKPDPCPFCDSPKTTFGFGTIDCATCGAKVDPLTASRLMNMDPWYRFNYIGYYHVTNGWAYRWCLPYLPTPLARAYAKGWLNVPKRAATDDVKRSQWLYEREAVRDSALIRFWA